MDRNELQTFKVGVAKFWEWFPTVAQRFFDTIEAGDCGELAEETGEVMAELLPHMAWVFGPGEDGGHSFTVSGEGLIAKQLLADYWQKQAVELPGWTFYAARQGSPLEELRGMAIAIGEQESVDSDSFMIQTNVVDEHEAIDIVAWHPLLEKIPEEHHPQILFLLLDEALGEFGTQTWIGNIEIEPIPEGAEHVRSLTQLPEYIKSVHKYHGWEKLDPPETISVYELTQQSPGPRGDTIVGSSTIPGIISEYVARGGKLEEDPLEDTGAELAYISMDTSQFPDGNQAEVRGNMEDAIEAALEEELSGRVLGGAFGTEKSYIDLLLFDGDNSREIVQRQMTELQLRSAKLHPLR
ncbi:MAG: hypothetical protein AAF483_02380 [Planctomycetota bacterium]